MEIINKNIIYNYTVEYIDMHMGQCSYLGTGYPDILEPYGLYQ